LLSDIDVCQEKVAPMQNFPNGLSLVVVDDYDELSFSKP